MEYTIPKSIPLSDNGEATVTPYIPERVNATGAVVILPGGAYKMLAGHEGDGYARFLALNGIPAFSVKYRVAPQRFPLQLIDARRAIRTVRANAAKYNIIPDKIAVMGSSAGGHLAALTSTFEGKVEGEGEWEIDGIDSKPNLQILCYPVILSPDEGSVAHKGSYINILGEENSYSCDDIAPAKLVSDTTPPAFIWHTSDDSGVNVINSYRYAEQLRNHGIPVEMHILPHGKHGLGLAPSVPYVARWGEWLISYLRENSFLE